jgi:hypothetical protein
MADEDKDKIIIKKYGTKSIIVLNAGSLFIKSEEQKDITIEELNKRQTENREKGNDGIVMNKRQMKKKKQQSYNR